MLSGRGVVSWIDSVSTFLFYNHWWPGTQEMFLDLMDFWMQLSRKYLLKCFGKGGKYSVGDWMNLLSNYLKTDQILSCQVSQVATPPNNIIIFLLYKFQCQGVCHPRTQLLGGIVLPGCHLLGTVKWMTKNSTEGNQTRKGGGKMTEADVKQ